VYRVALKAWAMATLVFTSIVVSAPAQAIEAYIFRGAGDFTYIADRLSFSEGMDTLGDKFKANGVHAQVYRWQAVDWAYRDIMKRRPDAVAIMGHSMGALASITLANRLKGSGIRVAYMGLIDIPGPAAMAPSNVEVAENFYSLFPVYGKLGKPRGHKGVVRNEFIMGQMHITIDSSKKVHTAMLAGAGNYKPSHAEPVMQAYAADTTNEGPGVMERVSSVVTGAIDKVKNVTARNDQTQGTSVSTHSGGSLVSQPSDVAPVMLMSSISTDDPAENIGLQERMGVELPSESYNRPLTGSPVMTSQFAATANGVVPEHSQLAIAIPVPTRRPGAAAGYRTESGLQPIE